jgi:hypothetical protein
MTKSRDLANAATALNAVTAAELGFVDGVTSAIQTQIDTKLATATAATTYVANSLADAKGDLLTATADNTPARLAVGSNGDTLVADSSATTGLRYQANQVAGRNAIINGDFLINQRAFTSNTTDGTYNFDRWRQGNNGGTYTLTPQTFTPGAAPIAGYEGRTFLQAISASMVSSTEYGLIRQRIEDVTRYAGNTVTISFFAKANTGTPAIAVELFQNFGTGGSPSSGVSIPAGAVTLSTSWARYSVTVAVPSISGKTLGTTVNTSNLELNLWTSAGSSQATRASSIGLQNFTASIWGVQLEYGSVATYFTTATGTIQGELAACKYYYDKRGGLTGTGTILNNALSNSAGTNAAFNFPITMRVAPTAVEYASLRLSDTSSGFTVSSVTLTNCTSTTANVNVATTGMTGFRSCYLDSSATGNYIAFSAEL